MGRNASAMILRGGGFLDFASFETFVSEHKGWIILNVPVVHGNNHDIVRNYHRPGEHHYHYHLPIKITKFYEGLTGLTGVGIGVHHIKVLFPVSVGVSHFIHHFGEALLDGTKLFWVLVEKNTPSKLLTDIKHLITGGRSRQFDYLTEAADSRQSSLSVLEAKYPGTYGGFGSDIEYLLRPVRIMEILFYSQWSELVQDYNSETGYVASYKLRAGNESATLDNLKAAIIEEAHQAVELEVPSRLVDFRVSLLDLGLGNAEEAIGAKV